MKLDKKEFEKKVREIRNMLPAYNNDRRVVVLSEYSKKRQGNFGTCHKVGWQHTESDL